MEFRVSEKIQEGFIVPTLFASQASDITLNSNTGANSEESPSLKRKKTPSPKPWNVQFLFLDRNLCWCLPRVYKDMTLRNPYTLLNAYLEWTSEDWAVPHPRNRWVDHSSTESVNPEILHVFTWAWRLQQASVKTIQEIRVSASQALNGPRLPYISQPHVGTLRSVQPHGQHMYLQTAIRYSPSQEN